MNGQKDFSDSRRFRSYDRKHRNTEVTYDIGTTDTLNDTFDSVNTLTLPTIFTNEDPLSVFGPERVRFPSSRHVLYIKVSIYVEPS